ncbi:hypothetical protein IQ255_27540 [Pleurocapsales cyanobacterium LEGE 10410]|nr:hypothetical protein [Pleurocapsales cyanobacterium LEGE 10410]
MNDKNYYLLVLLWILFASIQSGCHPTSGDDNHINEPSGELMPLQVGNWWEYQIIKPQWANPIQDTVRNQIVKIISVSTDEQNYTVFGHNFVPFSDNSPEYYWLIRNGQNGLYQMGGIAETDSLILNNLEYPYPGEIGDSILIPQLSFSRENLNFYFSDSLHITLIDKKREVITPVGLFNCYVYHFSLSAGDDVLYGFDYFLYFSPGLGLVKQEERRETDQSIITELLLIDYEIK